MQNYQVLPVSSIKPFQMRDKRQDVINRLTERIRTGYNPARPISVIADNDRYLAADGNHRLDVVTALGIKDVPCLIYPEGTNPYSLAVQCNQDEDTYAPMDLFDWLDVIKKLKNDGYTLQDIADKLGWKTKQQVGYYSKIIESVSTNVLDLAKKYQSGRVDKKSTSVDFTEWWFRDSGFYGLNNKYQLSFMESFIVDKCKWSKEKVQKETARYKLWQDFIKIAEAELVNAEDLPIIIEQIENNSFKTDAQLRQKIKDFNSRAKNKLICGDSLIEFEQLTDCSIDLVITDPPYGIDYISNRSQYAEHVTKDGVANDATLDEAIKLFDGICEVLHRKTKPDAHIYVFTSWKVYQSFAEILIKYFTVKNLLIWDKGNHGSGDLEGSWGNQYEMIIFATKGKKALNKRRGDIIQIPRLSSDKMIHPTQKPIELISELLSVSAQKADTVCDPFMGSGSTIKAVKEYSGLSYIGIELDREMFEKAKSFIGGD